MKNIAQKVLFLLLIIFSSCSSTYHFSVEVQEPAAITLPVSAQNVLILNNTLTQPIEYGIERKLDGKSISSDYPLSLDSAAWSAIDEISYILGKSDFFNTVAVYNQSLRKDNEWLSILQLSTEQKNELFDIGNYNALLVIDRLLISLNQNVTKIKLDVFNSFLSAFVDLRAYGILTCSMYTPENEKQLIRFVVSDSLFAKSTIYTDSTEIFKDIPNYILHELSYNLGSKVANCFIPSWKSVDRFLFISQNPRMREAVSYAANYKWVNAESIWKAQLDKNNKPVENAKIAYNLAVANEMQDKFETALEWILKAKEYMKNVNIDNNSQETERIDKYTTELGQRVQNNRLLDLQFGKK